MLTIYQTVKLPGYLYSLSHPPLGTHFYYKHDIELPKALIEDLCAVHCDEQTLLAAIVKENEKLVNNEAYKAFTKQLLNLCGEV